MTRALSRLGRESESQYGLDEDMPAAGLNGSDVQVLLKARQNTRLLGSFFVWSNPISYDHCAKLRRSPVRRGLPALPFERSWSPSSSPSLRPAGQASARLSLTPTAHGSYCSGASSACSSIIALNS